jgi:hypothetical protein
MNIACAILVVAVPWAASGIAYYYKYEGGWSWPCLLGLVYGPFIWLGWLMQEDRGGDAGN